MGRRLLCGGPVNLHPDVAKAVTDWSFSHRDPECRDLIHGVTRRLNAVMGLHNHSHHVALTTGSGTTANEMVLASAVGDGDSVLVLSNGEFGDRLAGMSQIYNKTTRLSFGWSGDMLLEKIERAIERLKPSLVAMVHCETSTGLLTPVDAVSKLCQARNIPLFVDMVSSFGADTVQFRPEEVAYLTTSSGKSLGALPGIAIIFAARDQVALQRERKPKSLSLNLARTIVSIEETGYTPNTVAVHLLAGLDAALRLIEQEGPAQRLGRIERVTQYLAASLSDVGWTIENDCVSRSNAVTCVKIPDDLSYEQVLKPLRHFGFSVHDGKGPYCGKIFQVSCTVGVDQTVVDEFCDALVGVYSPAEPVAG